MLSEPRSRRWKRFVIWSGRQCSENEPIRAGYGGRDRLPCPHRLAGIAMGRFGCCAISTVAKASADSRHPVHPETGVHCAGEAEPRGIVGRRLAHYAEPFAAADLRCRSRGGCGGSAGRLGSAERTAKQLPEQVAGDRSSQRSDGVGTMAFGAYAASRAGGSSAAAPGLIVQHGRRGQRGKNGSARRPGTHMRRYIRWRDGESRANHVLHSVLIPTPA